MKRALQLLSMSRAPSVLALLIGALFIALPDGTIQEKHRFAEVFAGDKAATNAWTRAGDAAVYIDIRYGDEYDVNGKLGYLNTITKLLQTDLGVLLAPVCSSYTRMNRGTSGRTPAFPLGRTHYEYVRRSNKMMNRTILLLWLLHSFGIFFLLEQPAGSGMEDLPRFKEFVDACGIKKKKLKMKD